MENKRKNIYIVIFIITTIIATCCAIYFGLSLKEEKNELAIERELMKSNTAKIEDLQTKLNIKEGDSSEIKEKILEKAVRVAFDPNRIKNPPANVTYSSAISGTTKGISNGVELLIDSNGSIKITREQESINVTGVTEKVIDALACVLGQGAEDTIVLLTEDGNLYYADDSIVDTRVKSIKFSKVEGISDICRVESVYSERKNSPSRARATVIAIDSNGDCYDLWYIHEGAN